MSVFFPGRVFFANQFLASAVRSHVERDAAYAISCVGEQLERLSVDPAECTCSTRTSHAHLTSTLNVASILSWSF